MYQPPKKIVEFPLKVYDTYTASKYILNANAYPKDAYVYPFGFVSDGRQFFGKISTCNWLLARKALMLGDNFYTVSGSEARGEYKLEVWAHSFGVKT